MFERLKSYFKFWNTKPVYHEQGTRYGGFRIDIDKYYSLEENKKELEELNKSEFGKMFNSESKKVSHTH